MSCFTYEGIDAIKTALRAGLALSTEVVPIKINLIAPPLYVMTTSTPERQDGLQVSNLHEQPLDLNRKYCFCRNSILKINCYLMVCYLHILQQNVLHYLKIIHS